MTYIEQAIKEAVKGDWKESLEIDRIEMQSLPERGNADFNRNPLVILHHADAIWTYSLADVLLDPAFWQAIGKARGWTDTKYTQYVGHKDHEPSTTQKEIHRRDWLNQQHRLIDHRAELKDAESFFKELLK